MTIFHEINILAEFSKIDIVTMYPVEALGSRQREIYHTYQKVVAKKLPL